MNPNESKIRLNTSIDFHSRKGTIDSKMNKLRQMNPIHNRIKSEVIFIRISFCKMLIMHFYRLKLKEIFLNIMIGQEQVTLTEIETIRMQVQHTINPIQTSHTIYNY